MSGELKTQGTQLYVIDELNSPNSVLTVGNLSSIDGVGGDASDIDVTNFDSLAMEYLIGLPDNGEAGLGLNLNPQDAVHQFLESIKGGARYKWAIGMSDGTAAPTIGVGGFTLPSTRTWLTYEASLKRWQYAFATNDAVRINAALRISGEITLTPKT